MPDPTRDERPAPVTTRPVIALHPDGVPVTLTNLSGGTRDLTAWGMVTVAGPGGEATAAALVLTDGPPATMGQARALADALDNDPNDPHMTVGSRGWEKERADLTEVTAKAWRENYLQALANLDRATDRIDDLERRAGHLTDLLAEERAAHATVTAAHMTQVAALQQEVAATHRETENLARGAAVVAVAVGLAAAVTGWLGHGTLRRLGR